MSNQACVQSIMVIIMLVQKYKLLSKIRIPWEIIPFYNFKLLKGIMVSYTITVCTVFSLVSLIFV